MNQSYDILFHVTFAKQALEVKARCPHIEDPLVTSLQEISADPLPGAMRDIASRRLRGVVHKKHVGGRKGHRLIYLHPIGSKVVIPVFISPTPKPPFDYNQINWEEICESFLETTPIRIMVHLKTGRNNTIVERKAQPKSLGSFCSCFSGSFGFSLGGRLTFSKAATTSLEPKG